MPRKYHCILAVSGLMLYLLGALLHLKLLSYVDKPFIFGDTGDGFFNMWVMDHTTRSLARGEIDVFDARIFWPENRNVILWSDNLFVPTAAFALFKTVTGDVMAAFWLTAMLLSAMAFAACFCLFLLVFLIVRHRHPQCPRRAVLFVPGCSYLACFSSARLDYFSHFQNLSSLWLFVLVAGVLGHLYSRRRLFFAAAALAQVILLYSALYFAVLGICFIALWAVFMLALDPRGIPRVLRENLAVVLICLLLFLPLAFAYITVPHDVHDHEVVHSSAMRLHHLVVPRQGLARTVVRALFRDLPATHHESPAYLGTGLLLALAAIATRAAFALVPRAIPSLRRLRLPTGSARREPLSPLVAFIVVCAITCYAVASGPRPVAAAGGLDPSPWGVLSLIVPGMRSMRAPGRLAAVGQGLLFTLAVLYLFHILATTQGKARLRVVCIAIALSVLQFVDQFGAHCSTTRTDDTHFTPTAGERSFFDGLEGPVLVFPTMPFHRNTYPMLYFSNFPNILLVNGYSARASTLFSRLMKFAEAHGSVNREQLVHARKAGCRHLAICKLRTSKRKVDMMRNSEYPVLFESDHFIVFPADPGQGVRK